eukprot:1358445-Amorphochlora_amoeboformis.AAC.1
MIGSGLRERGRVGERERDEEKKGRDGERRRERERGGIKGIGSESEQKREGSGEKRVFGALGLIGVGARMPRDSRRRR